MCQSVGGVEPLDISKASRSYSTSLLAFCRGRFSTGTTASACLYARHFSFSLYTTGAFQPPTQCWSSEGVSLIKSICGFYKRNSLRLQQFLPWTQSPLVFAAGSCRDLSSWHWNPGLGDLVWVWESLLMRYPSQIFIHMGVGPAYSASAPLLPVWMDVVFLIL